MSELNEKVEAIFEAALALETDAQRVDYLNRVCPDPALRRDVESLLAAHQNPDSIFEEETVLAPTRLSEGPGTRIDRYKLLQQIGEGGMGVVYMAEQEEPVRRRVALKIIKLGMDTKQVVARFEAERQALALMDHPNIAKVLDGGATDTGRPYFVMELVQGVPITEFCDKAKLSAKERLKLFMQVCQAIQSAHQKGIIHRDIKPSNVLVTLHDGVPVPKVIDFGIAKATNQKLTEKTLFTNFATMIGTPAYMSPEQAEMSGLDIDTRTDIYALGVLLYALLTGTTPFPEKRLRSLGYGEMQRVILEEEPERPSTRLSTMANEQKTIVARNCGEELASLSNLLKGDLDWIVMKCLEKDRQRRYETANGLAADIQRHLSNEPVIARPPSAAYRFQKLVRRNKLAFAAAAAVLCALTLGILFSTWQAVRASRAREIAVLAQQNESKQRHTAEAQQQRAEHERQRALENELTARESLYAAQMSQALEAWFEADTIRAKDLLDRQRPRGGQKDLRGLEWRLLWQRCQPSSENSIVGRAARTPDGKTFLVYYNQKVASLYDLASRREVGRIEGVWTMASRNADFVAVATTNNRVSLWNVSERREIASQPKSEDWTWPLSLSQNGAQLTCLTTNGVLKIWNLYSGTLDSEIDLGPKSEDGTWPLSLSQNRAQLTYLTTNGVLKIWNLYSGTLTAELDLGSDQVGRLTFSDDEKRIAFNTPEHIQVWDIGAKRALMSVSFTQSEFVTGPVFDPDGALVAYSLRDNTISVWEVTTGRRVASLPGHTGRVNGIQFSPDGKLLVSISDDATAKVWSRASWSEVTTFKGHHSALYSLAFSPDGQLLATSGNDLAVKVWSLSKRTDVATFRGHTADVRSLAFSPDGQTLVSCARDGSIRFWDVNDPKDDSLLGKHASWVRSVAFSSAGLLASGSMDGSIKLWDTTRCTEIATVREPGGAMVCNLAFSPDGQTLASSHQDNQVRLWSVATRKETEALPVQGHGGWISKVSFSPDGRTLAFGDAEKNLMLWNLAAHRVRSTIRGFTEQVGATAFSPDGKIVAAGERNGTMTLWNRATTNLLSRHDAHPGDLLMDLNFSPDGKLLATAGWDRLVKLWDVSQNTEKATFKGHRGVVDTAVFSPDGNTLVTASADSTVKLWRVDMQLEVGTLRGHTSPATTVAFSLDGTLLATAGGDTTIRLWRAPSWAEIEAAERADSRTQ